MCVATHSLPTTSTVLSTVLHPCPGTVEQQLTLRNTVTTWLELDSSNTATATTVSQIFRLISLPLLYHDSNIKWKPFHFSAQLTVKPVIEQTIIIYSIQERTCTQAGEVAAAECAQLLTHGMLRTNTTTTRTEASV